MLSIEARSLQELYPKVLRLLLERGDRIAPRELPTLEVTGARLFVHDASQNIVAYRARGLNYYFSIAELLWILLGQKDTASVGRWNSQVLRFSDNGHTFAGAYGPRFNEQLPYVVEKLQEDASSRQAVITLWQPTPRASKDVACTVAFQYLLRDDRLHAVTFMRSNDAWLGLPYDVFNFTSLQAYVAAALGVEVGSYTHLVGSLHLYTDRLEGAWEVAQEEVSYRPKSPRLTYPAPLALRALFNELSVEGHEVEPGRIRELLGSLDDVWARYLVVLAHREHRKDVMLSEPWRTLVPEYGIELSA